MSLSRRAALHAFFITSLSLLPPPAYSKSNPYFDKYDRYASSYELLDGRSPFTKLFGFDTLRATMLDKAFGDVLEVGIGTGLNLPLYNPSNVSSITGLDFSSEMLAEARKKVAYLEQPQIPITLVQAPAEQINLPSASFDCVVDTFSLCVFPYPEKALLEMHRMLRKTSHSRAFLLEHTLSSNPALAAYQNFTAEPTAGMSKGCYPNQNVRDMVLKAGFVIVDEKNSLGGSVTCLELMMET